MSFMFNPYPYDDPNAYNVLDAQGIGMKEEVTSNIKIAEAIADLAHTGNVVIGIDGYATSPYEMLQNLIEQQCALKNISISIVNTEILYKDEEYLNAQFLKNNLPMDREKDPVLLYGRLFHGSYEDIMETAKIDALKSKMAEFKKSGKGILLIIGAGSLCASLRSGYDEKIYVDVTPMKTMLNLKAGKYRNIGMTKVLHFKTMARRAYFVDFELASHLRCDLLVKNELDHYILATDPDKMKMISLKLMRQIFDLALSYPLRTKPVYLEGVWGGYYIQRLRNLPKEMKNCAWVFDFIPMEVSIVFDLNGERLEFPFYTLVQASAEKLVGKESVKEFGRFFPVRFNYDDTWHANGNMSIQCHPTEKYIKEENGEYQRQDESYYIVNCEQGAKTYLGFNNDIDPEEFIAATKKSEKDGSPIDYQKYVYGVDSKPGVQVMIPAGTIHASGRNQLILEIGSLTVGSYTYKMYDYLRKDLDGSPRPIHTYHGDKVLARDRNADWVNANVVQAPRHICGGENWEEYTVGEHDLLYFSLRNIKFVDKVEQDTQESFHVLSLVDGEQVMIRSKSNPERFFIQNYLEIVIVPAEFGEYEIINMKEGTTAIEHKTLLKK